MKIKDDEIGILSMSISVNMEAGRLHPDSTIALKESLRFFHRHGDTLVVEPESASWTVLDAPAFEILQALETPLPLKELEERYPHIEEARLRQFLRGLFNVQCVSIDGRVCHDPALLWSTGQVFPYFINIHVTSRCNFHCTYCYNSPGAAGDDMPLETALYLQKKMFLEIPGRHLTFQFHGGEPLLRFHEIIVPFARSAEKLSRMYNKTSRVLLQTNGSLITREIAHIMKEMDMGVGISLDGHAPLYNLCRVYPDGRGTFDDVLRGFQHLVDAGKHTAPLACIQEPCQYELLVKGFLEKGIPDFVIRPAYPIGMGKQGRGITPENASHFAAEFLKTPDLLCEYNRDRTADFFSREEKENRRAVFRNLTYYLELLVSRERPNMCLRSPCGAGNCIISFDTNGDIYPFEEMVVHKKFRIGNIFQRENMARTIIESPAYRLLNERRVEILRGCRECTWRRFCGGGCPSKIAASGNSLDYGDHYCIFNRVVLEECAWRLAHEPELVNGVFTLEYLRKHPVDSSLWKISPGPVAG